MFTMRRTTWKQGNGVSGPGLDHVVGIAVAELDRILGNAGGELFKNNPVYFNFENRIAI